MKSWTFTHIQFMTDFLRITSYSLHFFLERWDGAPVPETVSTRRGFKSYLKLRSLKNDILNVQVTRPESGSEDNNDKVFPKSRAFSSYFYFCDLLSPIWNWKYVSNEVKVYFGHKTYIYWTEETVWRERQGKQKHAKSCEDNRTSLVAYEAKLMDWTSVEDCFPSSRDITCISRLGFLKIDNSLCVGAGEISKKFPTTIVQVD